MKHRLTGALVLVAMVVIIVPILLRSPGSPDTDSASANPDVTGPGASDFVSKILPVDPPADSEPQSDAAPIAEPQTIDLVVGSDSAQPVLTPPAAGGQAVAALEPAATGPAPEADQPVAEPASPQSPVQPTPPRTGKSEPAAAVEIGWIVQVGTYGQAENAKRMMDRLEQHGFEARSTIIANDKGELTRVWVGPFAERVQASRARSEIEGVVGEKGLIVAYP